LKPSKSAIEIEESHQPKVRRVFPLKCPHGEFPVVPYTTGFDLAQFREGLRAGVFPLGMIVRAEDGDVVAVCGVGKAYRTQNGNGGQQIVNALPRQWTVEL
jgi:hypothetical protein